MKHTRKIVLASGSSYRQRLLKKIVDDFETCAPDIDESALPNETPRQLSSRLAFEKAEALTERFPNHLLIGSDQVAMLGNQQLHKPGNRDNCIAQLRRSSGQQVTFFTSLCIHDSQRRLNFLDVDECTVYFRTLSESQITQYVDFETPYDCAGGFKSEGRGILLFERIQADDPNALVGLPLIKLSRLFEQAGYPLL